MHRRSLFVLLGAGLLAVLLTAAACAKATPEPTAVAPTATRTATPAPTATVKPTTAAPTTVAPTTIAPTTVAPTTVAPTTVAPTTVAPTTVAPTTVAPTTVAPTTVAPTTVAPTPPATPAGLPTATFTLSLKGGPNRFAYVSGTNSDGSAGPTNIDNINTCASATACPGGWSPVVYATQNVEISIDNLAGTHNINVFKPEEKCTGGGEADPPCAASLAGTGSIDKGAKATLTFTWATAGEALNLVCMEHPSSMRTTIKVVAKP